MIRRLFECQLNPYFIGNGNPSSEDDIFTELQLVCQNPDQAAKLLDAVEDRLGDLDEFWAILDGGIERIG